MSDKPPVIPSAADIWNDLLEREQEIRSWFPPDLRDDGFSQLALRILARAQTMHSQPPELRPDNILSAEYLRTVAANLTRNERKKWRHQQLPGVTDDQDESRNLEFADEAAPDRLALRDALLRLRPAVTPAQWRALVLTGLYDLESKLVGEILRTSANSIDKLTERGRSRLRSAFPTLGHFGDQASLTANLVQAGGAIRRTTVAPRPVPLVAPGRPTRLRMRALPEVRGQFARCSVLVHVQPDQAASTPQVSDPVPARLDTAHDSAWRLEFVPAFDGTPTTGVHGDVTAIYLFEGDWLLDDAS